VGAGGDPGAPTINVKTSMAGSLEGIRAVDAKASIINTKKHQRQAPWEVLEL
jgi:hypothetical protein